MHDHPLDSHDVVIAGAGPVGLFLACELRLFKLSVLVLERAQAPQAPLKRLPFGLRGLSVATLEAFHRRGLLDELLAAQQARDASDKPAPAPHWAGKSHQPGGHFAGIQFHHDAIDGSRWPYRLPSPAGEGMAVELEMLETVLARRAVAMGAEIRRGHEVDRLLAGEDSVSVRAGGESFRGRWLVGCDGGRSTVRKLAGIAFAGTDPEFTGYSVEAELRDPRALRPGRHYTPHGMYTFTPPGTIAMVDFDGGACHRGQSITLEHAQTVLRRVSGVDVELTRLLLASTWTDRAYQARTYRQGRVLLAGDAAHIHSPLGGQGLNLGIGDAMNLAWKLASTMRGGTPEAMLDSYQAERHPAGAGILDWSRAQVALMRPTASTRALAAIMRDLAATDDGAAYLAERVWGLSLRYPLGDGHPLMGCSLPEFELGDGTLAGSLLRDGKGLFLDFERDPQRLAEVRRWQGRVACVASEARDSLGLRAVLVRPDGFVAWATDSPSDAAGLSQALGQWFGEPGDTDDL
ncbi:FAD-dependent monooxygenase [Burkholderia gladioli]|uniref:FAD-dependent monooxygenase n=1 Tax=Burkholderia gladioli TaxID=28095 RepID=UPI00163E8120|nr:FAD-dependent monooxygenase [Burkholderia gladioli]